MLPNTTGPSLMDLSRYFHQDEFEKLDALFRATLKEDAALVFWTGISPTLAKTWADKKNLKTLTMAMGSFYSDHGSASLRSRKSTNSWSTFMKGASGVFAQHACYGRHAIVLTKPPPNIYSTRPCSNYRNIEEPILKGFGSDIRTIRIDYAHPVVTGAECFVYQRWPEDRSCEWFQFLNTISSKALVSNVIECESSDGDSSERVDSIEVATGSRTEVSTLKLKAAAFFRPKEQRLVISHDEQYEDEKKRAKRHKVEEEQRKAEERKRAKRLKVEQEQRKNGKKRTAKLLRVEEQQRKADEKRTAKRLRVEDQQRKAEQKRAAKLLRVEDQQRKAKERKKAKRLIVEEEQRKVKEKKRARRSGCEEPGLLSHDH